MLSLEEDVEYWSTGQLCQFSLNFLPKLWEAQFQFRQHIKYLRERAKIIKNLNAQTAIKNSIQKGNEYLQKWITDEQDSIIKLAEMMLSYYAQSSSKSQNIRYISS